MLKTVLDFVALMFWPTTVLTIFLLSRTHLSDLIERMTKIKIQDFEVELREKIVSLVDEADRIERTPASTSRDALVRTDASKEQKIALAQHHPVAAIMEKWADVEAAVYRRFSETVGEDWPGVLSAIDGLYSNKKISGEEVKLFNRLYEIRNIVAHNVREAAVSTGYALEFSYTADLLLRRII